MANSFVFFEEQFRAGYLERLQKVVDLWNERSAGGMIITAQDLMGRIYERSFMKRPDGVTRANLSSQTEASVVDVNEDIYKSAYIYGLVGPYQYTRFDAQSRNMSAEDYSAFLGEVTGELVMEDMAESTVSAVVGALTATSDLTYTTDDGSGNLTEMTTSDLNLAFNRMGDKRRDIVAVLMHSKPFADLIGNNIASDIDEVAGFAAIDGVPASLGKPILVADIEALQITDASGNVTGYRSLAMRDAGSTTAEILSPEMTEKVKHLESGTGNQIAGDYQFDVQVKGYSFDADNIQNPTVAELADSANWTFKHGTEVKQGAGVVIETL